MVTIEQKLTLFSKLLNQDIKEENELQLKELEKEYSKRIAQAKYKVDKEAAELVEQAKKRASMKQVELISKGKMSSKKETMMIKEQMINQFMEALTHRIKTFTTTPAYKKYLLQVISSLKNLEGYENPLVIFLSSKDLMEYEAVVKEALIHIGVSESKLSFEEANKEMLGGLIIKDPLHNTRIDASINAVLEDGKDYIIEKITLAIGEVGEDID